MTKLSEPLERIARRIADAPAKDPRASSIRDAVYDAALKELRTVLGLTAENDLPERRG